MDCLARRIILWQPDPAVANPVGIHVRKIDTVFALELVDKPSILAIDGEEIDAAGYIACIDQSGQDDTGVFHPVGVPNGVEHVFHATAGIINIDGSYGIVRACINYDNIRLIAIS